MSLMLLSTKDVKKCITMHDAISAMESAFIQLAKNQVELPLRTSLPIKNENGICLTMPAYLQEKKELGLKVVSLFPKNHQYNLPAINGVILLLDATTGQPKALMDASYLTALRTGAVSGLATKLLAKEDAKHVAILGSGVQTLAQLDAIRTVRDIQHVSIWSRTHEHALSFAKQIDHELDVNVMVSISEAVKDADIICTATQSTEALVHLADIKNDVHINAIGSHTKTMSEIAPDVFIHAVTVVDQQSAACAEAGEIIQALELNMLRLDELLELGDLLINKRPELKAQRTIFKSVGLAIQDISIAEMVYQNAIHNQIGQPFELS